MSLATRCTACGTIFRVVEDQLRVSDGWVRCGRCAEVFDARELLFDIERDAPPAWPTAFVPSAPAPMPPAAEPEITQPPAPPPEPDFEIAPTPSAGSDERIEPRWADEPAPPEPSFSTEALMAASEERADSALAAQPATDAPTAVPEFMRRAQATARWQRPGVRIALGLTALLLLLALALQAALHFRDAVAALYPPATPALNALCSLSGCSVEPWRRADVLAIDSTSLTPLGSRNAYRLALSLRNKSGVEVAMPWIELSVTDANGALLARRVLPPTALSPALTRLAADSEQALQLSFSGGAQRVSGYSLLAFHP